MIVNRPAVNQTAATAAPKIFFLLSRCLNGRKVACIRSKEIAVRFVIETAGKQWKINKAPVIAMGLDELIVQMLQSFPREKNPEDQSPCIKRICNCQADRQVYATLAKSSLFQGNNDCQCIQCYHSNSLDAKCCQPGNALR